jgi:hypothetical protein
VVGLRCRDRYCSYQNTSKEAEGHPTRNSSRLRVGDFVVAIVIRLALIRP